MSSSLWCSKCLPGSGKLKNHPGAHKTKGLKMNVKKNKKRRFSQYIGNSKKDICSHCMLSINGSISKPFVISCGKYHEKKCFSGTMHLKCARQCTSLCYSCNLQTQLDFESMETTNVDGYVVESFKKKELTFRYVP